MTTPYEYLLTTKNINLYEAKQSIMQTNLFKYILTDYEIHKS